MLYVIKDTGNLMQFWDFYVKSYRSQRLISWSVIKFGTLQDTNHANSKKGICSNKW